MRVVVVKPDWSIRGGAELVLDRFEAMLRQSGHRVERRSIPIPALPRTPFRVGLPERAWHAVPEYFRYLAILDAVEQIDVSGSDLVVSTHAPSFAVEHARHLNLFFHHLRVFYDLDEVYRAAGLADDPELHLHARDRVRQLDQPRMERVGWFCANSEVTAARLDRFNGLTDVSVHHAGVGIDIGDGAGSSAAVGRGAVLCTSRSEFTKRTELFAAAMHLVGGGLGGVLAGDGGRLPFVAQLDRRLSAGELHAAALDPGDTWLNRGRVGTGGPAVGNRLRRLVARSVSPVRAPSPSPVRLAGRVEDEALGRLYAEAPCVVAPAYGEDYGLTAVEAMAHGRPVVVCRDGGGLTTIVDDGVDGLVVEPTPVALAAGIQKLVDDPDLAAELGAAGREKAATFTWERCHREFADAVERVLS